MDGFWRLPANISTFGAEIDSMFLLIAVITGIVFVAVEVVLIFFLIRYRWRPERKAFHTHGNSRLEMIWTGATAVIVVIIGMMSRGLWLDIKDERRFPPAGLEVIVTAKQFEWNVTYPGADNRLGTADDFVTRNQLHVPANIPVHLVLRSEDVIHSFYLPELRLKQDAVPGMDIRAWFEATQPGQYTLGCAELCGLGHYRMKGAMTVHTSADWATWNGQQIAAAAGDAAVTAANAAGSATATDANAPGAAAATTPARTAATTPAAAPDGPTPGLAAADHEHH
ncbi:MAG TPA: cytochrome c oxidase subunit II [Longimicrobiales bacterium]|nr:cytochrome c oxidase subunit II [Longimicrobiales bacterium]